MLKWLVNVYGQEGTAGQEIPDKITEDPLATIKLGKKKRKTDQIYSVNRFNPLFEEEAVIETNISKDVTDDQETISTTSSGYGSNTTHKEQLKRETKSIRVESQTETGNVTKTSLKISSQVENAKDETGIIPSPVWPQIIIDRNREENYVTSIEVMSEGSSEGGQVTFLPLQSAESEKDSRQQDSIVTQSLLMLMTGSDTDNKPELAVKSKQAVSVTGAVASARRSFRGMKGTIRSSSRKIVRRNKQRSKTGSLRSAGSVEAVRELWSKTGMRTNGRKLLLGAMKEQVNAGYESDNSQVSLPRERRERNFPQTTRRQTSSSSSSSLEEATRSRPRLVRKVERKLHDPDRIDRVENIIKDNNTAASKHVRFNHNRYLREPGTQLRPVNNLLWDRYYGATEAGLRMVTSSNTFGSDFTIDMARNKSLVRVDKRRRKTKCCCKISCFILLLISFLLVIITVTYLLTKGKRYFGAL